MGSPKRGGYCIDCDEKRKKKARVYKEEHSGDEYLGYIGDTYVTDYPVNRKFVEDEIGIIKKTFGIVR